MSFVEACLRNDRGEVHRESVLGFAGIGIYTLGVACIAALAVTGMLATRRGLALVLLAVLIEAAALVGPDWSRFLLLHGHDCLALAVWLAWRKRPTRVSINLVTIAACAELGPDVLDEIARDRGARAAGPAARPPTSCRAFARRSPSAYETREPPFTEVLERGVRSALT